MEQEQRCKVQIDVISGEQFKCHRSIFLNHRAFVIVRTDSGHLGRTGFARRGGCFPSWNESLKLTLPPTARFLQVEVYCKTVFGVKLIGKAKIPVTDFAGETMPARYLHFLSYRLRNREGEKNGIINLSVRMDGRESASGPLLYEISEGGVAGSGLPRRMEVLGSIDSPSLSKIPAGKIAGSRLAVRGERMDGVAVGIPVSHGYPV